LALRFYKVKVRELREREILRENTRNFTVRLRNLK